MAETVQVVLTVAWAAENAVEVVADAGVADVVVAAVGTVEVAEASVVAEMVAVVGIVAGSETGVAAEALSGAEAAVETVAGLAEAVGTAVGDEVVVAVVVVSDRAAVVVGTAAGAVGVGEFVELVLETGMAELASSLVDVDWMLVAKVVTFDLMESAVGTSEVNQPDWDAEVVT